MQHRDPRDDIEADVAGQSARREFERRRQLRRERVAARGRATRFAAAVTAEPQSTRAWDQGAKGEELVGARLDRLRERGIGILHDRKIPRRGNIDHLAVTTGGVWIIDTKRYKGRPEPKVEGGLFRPRTEPPQGRRTRPGLACRGCPAPGGSRAKGARRCSGGRSVVLRHC